MYLNVSNSGILSIVTHITVACEHKWCDYYSSTKLLLRLNIGERWDHLHRCQSESLPYLGCCCNGFTCIMAWVVRRISTKTKYKEPYCMVDLNICMFLFFSLTQISFQMLIRYPSVLWKILVLLSSYDNELNIFSQHWLQTNMAHLICGYRSQESRCHYP